MEMISVFNEQFERIGTASRHEVHAKGLWHETFHCWLIERGNEPMIYLQLRSPLKKDYPNLYDITAAGHLLATETVEQGVREMAEELGVYSSFEELQKLGVIRCEIISSHMMDREFCHVFLYEVELAPIFQLQQEEVADIVKIMLHDFYRLVEDNTFSMTVSSLCQTGTERTISKELLVPHSESYYAELIHYLKEKYQ